MKDKTVITLKGDGIIFQVEDTSTDDMIEQDGIISGVELWDSEIEDITKKKGKYVKQKYIHDWMERLNSSGSIIFRQLHKTFHFEFTYDIEVPSSEFNPKLIQLIKSDYEFEGIPYYIVTDKILYDGKEIHRNEDNIDYGMTSYSEEDMEWYDGMYYYD